MAVSRFCWQEQPALIILVVARMATRAHLICLVARSTAGVAAPSTTVVPDARQPMEPARLALQVQITVAADPTDTFVLARFHAVHAMDSAVAQVTIAQLQLVVFFKLFIITDIVDNDFLFVITDHDTEDIVHFVVFFNLFVITDNVDNSFLFFITDHDIEDIVVFVVILITDHDIEDIVVFFVFLITDHDIEDIVVFFVFLITDDYVIDLFIHTILNISLFNSVVVDLAFIWNTIIDSLSFLFLVPDNFTLFFIAVIVIDNFVFVITDNVINHFINVSAIYNDSYLYFFPGDNFLITNILLVNIDSLDYSFNHNFILNLSLFRDWHHYLNCILIAFVNNDLFHDNLVHDNLVHDNLVVHDYFNNDLLNYNVLNDDFFPATAKRYRGPQPTTTAAVVNVPRPKIGSVPYGSVIYGCAVPGDIAITFDDGPYIYTSDLLDLLSSNGVKATFFIVGNLHGAIDQTPEWTSVIQRMNSEGHHIASHTWTHPDLTTLSSGERKDQMYQNEQAFVNILGKFPTYMRPPYLAFDGACQQDMSDLGYHVISTNLDTKDYENDSPDLIVNSENTFNDTVTQNSPSSSSFIVLNHDIHEQTVHTLAQFEIDKARANGYRPVTVGECLGDPAGNWYRAGP
ncbi:hypothetical protein LTR25_008534 [Vermiconidia calcicola]|uniref:NodB homology domain-containing protein n=1 Tax=Vermiconidia calcicola TaxID=1690605 RepID=A0AAV9PY67_9PEZI|nr:hypothetical protein LTR25_008534 [Vermiconidia calcicola]